jgi:hypothetical protein
MDNIRYKWRFYPDVAGLKKHHTTVYDHRDPTVPRIKSFNLHESGGEKPYSIVSESRFFTVRRSTVHDSGRYECNAFNIHGSSTASVVVKIVSPDVQKDVGIKERFINKLRNMSFTKQVFCIALLCAAYICAALAAYILWTLHKARARESILHT